MKLFSTTPSGLIGIDIGSESIKLVELAGSRNKPKVITWGVTSLPKEGFIDGVISNPVIIADTLNQLLLSSGSKTTNVAVSVSSSQAITKIIGMPNDMRETELEEQVSIEALHFIPYPIDEVNIDFSVIGPSRANANENDVLLVACRRNIVDSYIDAIEDIGLELSYVDIDTYAIERTFRAANKSNIDKKSPIAIFDIGSSTSHLMVLDNERVTYSRHQSFGAAQLIKQIRRAYGVSAEEAQETLKSTNLPDGFYKDVQQPFMILLQQELKRSLQFFYSSSSVSEVSNILLTGTTSALEGIDSHLTKLIGIPVGILDPLVNANVRVKREAAKRLAPSLSTAYGLALRGLN